MQASMQAPSGEPFMDGRPNVSAALGETPFARLVSPALALPYEPVATLPQEQMPKSGKEETNIHEPDKARPDPL